MSDSSDSDTELEAPVHEEPQFGLMPYQFEPIASAPSSPSGAMNPGQAVEVDMRSRLDSSYW